VQPLPRQRFPYRRAIEQRENKELQPLLLKELSEVIRSHNTLLQTIRDGIMVPSKQERKQCKVVLKRSRPVAFGARTLATSARIRGKLTHIVALILI
jgi:hypothetical protein